jgi:hypothetical protein
VGSIPCQDFAHSEEKGRQFGLKSHKRSKIAEQTTEYYTPFNNQHSDMTCWQGRSILIYQNGKNTDVKDGEIRMMNWYLVLLFSFLGSEIKSTSRKRNMVKCRNGLG